MRLSRAQFALGLMTAPSFDPIAIALEEDIGEGDITSEFFVPATAQVSAQIIAREKAIIAGTETATEVFHRIDPQFRFGDLR